MQERITLEFFNLLKVIFISPMAGWIFTICLFEIMQKSFSYQFPKESLKRKKKQCWIYLSMAVFCLGLIIKTFTH